jgi:hypothetical protein
LTDAHLRREYVSHREFSSEDLGFKAAVREGDFASPFSVKIKNIIISMLYDLSIFTPIWDWLIFKGILYSKMLFYIDLLVAVQALSRNFGSVAKFVSLK